MPDAQRSAMILREQKLQRKTAWSDPNRQVIAGLRFTNLFEKFAHVHANVHETQ